jgi:hypothetical protein
MRDNTSNTYSSAFATLPLLYLQALLPAWRAAEAAPMPTATRTAAQESSCIVCAIKAEQEQCSFALQSYIRQPATQKHVAAHNKALQLGSMHLLKQKISLQPRYRQKLE